jgi:FkbM family methyltransferase
MLKMALFSFLLKSGIFRIRAVRTPMFRVYFALKRRYYDIYYDLIVRRPELFTGGFILDVGANIGCTSTFFSDVVSPGFCVYAFESAPDNFYLLQQCIASYHRERKITAVHAAVGDHDGRTRLEINKLNPTAHRVLGPEPDSQPLATPTIEVPLISLDSFCVSHKVHPIKFVKIDVEGYELFVCRAMTEILALNPEIVVGLEVGAASQSSMGYDRNQLLEFFLSRSFHLYTARKGELQGCSIQDLDRMLESTDHVDVLASRSRLV